MSIHKGGDRVTSVEPHEYERRVKRCLYEMQQDEGQDRYRPKYYQRILEGKDTAGKGI